MSPEEFAQKMAEEIRLLRGLVGSDDARIADFEKNWLSPAQADALRARVLELEGKLEAAEQHVTICQRANTEEVERRRKADSVLKRIHHLAHAIGHNTFVGLDGPDSKQNFAREIAEMALRESEEP